MGCLSLVILLISPHKPLGALPNWLDWWTHPFPPESQASGQYNTWAHNDGCLRLQLPIGFKHHLRIDVIQYDINNWYFGISYCLILATRWFSSLRSATLTCSRHFCQTKWPSCDHHFCGGFLLETWAQRNSCRLRWFWAGQWWPTCGTISLSNPVETRPSWRKRFCTAKPQAILGGGKSGETTRWFGWKLTGAMCPSSIQVTMTLGNLRKADCNLSP